MPEASFVYPSRGVYNDTVNVNDRVYVTYTSQWSSVNLTLFCLQSATSDTYLVHNAANNPILANGTYDFRTIGAMGFKISQYPVLCHYKLTEYQNKTNGVNGGGFNLTSTAGAAKTFQLQETSSGTIYPVQSATGVDAGVSTTTMSDSPATSTSSSTASPTPAPSSGLSSGAAAGIGVGVSLGVVLILAIVGYLFWSKRRRARQTTAGQPSKSFDYAQSGPANMAEKKALEKTQPQARELVDNPIYESDSQPVNRQELMANEPPQYPTMDGRPTAELP